MTADAYMSTQPIINPAPAIPLHATSNSLAGSLVTASASRPAPERSDDEELLEGALKRFRQISSYESEWRNKAVQELNFTDGLEHWTAEMIEERKGRPCLTFDRISPSIDQVVNDMRQNPPEPRVSAVGEGADKETASILQGILRNIDQDSGGDIACITGYEHGVKIGRGWWRLLVDWEQSEELDKVLFDQKLVYRRVPNPFSVYPDPSAQEFDYSDMRYCFVTDDLPKDVFDELYRDKSIITGMTGFSGVGDTVRADWFPDQCVRVAEYWWVETTQEHIFLLSDGSVVFQKDIAGREVIADRRRERRTVRGAKITALDVLERWEWSGKWIPVIPVIGKEILKNGKKQLRGMIRPAMDANLSYDYMRSKQVEAVALAPIAPWIIAASQIEGYENIWKDSNRRAEAFLPYKHVAEGGTLLPPPQRNTAEPAIQAITIAVAHADNDIKATLSSYDASLGAPGPEQSGRAIIARQREGDNAHFNYHDNLARSMRHTGRVIVDLIPHIYTDERIVTIIDPDGKQRQVTINAPTMVGEIEKLYKIGKKFGLARYDVTVGTGPSYASRRAEGNAALMQLTQAMPQAMMRALDLVIKALDIPNSEELAARLRPADVPADQSETGVPPVIQAKLDQAQQMIQQLSQTLEAQSEIIKTKRLEIESAERITAMKEENANWRAMAASKSAELQTLAKLDHQAIEDKLEHREVLLHIDQTVEQDAAGEKSPQPQQ